MPELPEVEAARLIIAEHCVGRTITNVQAEEDQSKAQHLFHRHKEHLNYI